MDFYTALQQAYFEDPCGVLSIPLWKTLPMIEGGALDLRLGEDGGVAHLEAWTDARLDVYWDRDNAWRPGAPEALLRDPAQAVIHSRYAARLPHSSNQTVQRFFRLRCQRAAGPFPLVSGFQFAPVRLPEEAGLVAQVIGRCYAHMRPSVNEVMRWIQQPVFDAALWVWIIDARVDQPAGLGIAELDRTLEEASLEWIQVIPEYRGQGLAKALVCELLGRLDGPARLITVSGEADNPSDAEHLYRRCGFTGHDVWWVIRRLGM